ncbi:hypothetical protein [Bifidobacterium animalis]|uniref:hypothetical protein n=1 Tax=Bifidobacterium animalis TaxID=28025 RepID=UPI00214A3990|nr:hypothetical protein [Bifidobacterium animalis]MCR1995831.1 hypothetical protein [Bifidobacterium animalis subsp. animalis]
MTADPKAVNERRMRSRTTDIGRWDDDGGGARSKSVLAIFAIGPTPSGKDGMLY